MLTGITKPSDTGSDTVFVAIGLRTRFNGAGSPLTIAVPTVEAGIDSTVGTGEAGRCGSRVDRYLVERLLGVGAFGAVYQARHARTDALVALKILKREMMADASTLERFMREARSAASVGDDHVVRVLDAEVTADGVAFIAMELLDGYDLKELAKREKPLHPARAVRLLAQALDGLAAAHEKGVIHRDMKPANIFVVRRKDARGAEFELAKILDFGISKMDGPNANPLTIGGATLGTPNYMAWEQFFDARQVDPRTDIYAVAVMLYELLAGRKPYEGEGIADLMQKVRIGGAQPLRTQAPSLPVPLCAVIDKGLANKPARRWATAREFSAALRNAVVLLGEPPPLVPREKDAVILEVRFEASEPELSSPTLQTQPKAQRPEEETLDGSPLDKTRER